MPGSDAFILKMNASGNRIWSTFFGGSSEELGQGISTNNLNEIVICGVTYSYNMFTTVGAFKTTYSSGISPPPTSEMFLANRVFQAVIFSEFPLYSELKKVA